MVNQFNNSNNHIIYAPTLEVLQIFCLIPLHEATTYRSVVEVGFMCCTLATAPFTNASISLALCASNIG